MGAPASTQQEPQMPMSFDELVSELQRYEHDRDVAEESLRTDLAAAEGEHDKVVAALAATIADQANEIGRLYDRLNVYEPPVSKTMSVGAVIGPKCHTVDGFVQSFGTPGVRRYFSQGDFARITDLGSVRADLGKWDRLISYKPPTLTVNPARLLACLGSIPNDGRRTVLMCQNEPERDDKMIDPAAWRPYVDTFIEQVVGWCDANGRTDIMPGWSFSYWRPLTDPTISEWWPTSPNRHRAVFGCQSYDPLARKTLREQTETPIRRWRDAGGELWMLSEVNTKRTGEDGAAWWRDGLTWAAGAGCLFAAVYDDVVGKDGPWCVNDPTVQAALRELMPTVTVTA